MKRAYWAGFCLLLACLLHRYAQGCGIGTTYDSLNYLHASHTWASVGKLLNRDGVPFLQQPPLFPLFLSLFAPHQAVASSWCNTLCLLTTVGVWAYIGARTISSGFLGGMYALLLACATPLLLVHQFLWSEPLFMAFMSGYFLAFFEYERSKKAVFWWAMLFFGALLPLQRAIGVVFLASSWFFLPARREKIGVFLACLPFVAWFGYVWGQKTLVGVAETYGIQDNPFAGAMMLLESLALWGLPAQIPTVGKAVFALLVVAWVGKQVRWREESRFARFLCLSLGFYLLILGAKKSDFSDTERFVAPLYPLVIYLIFSKITLPTTPRKWLVMSLLCLACLYPLGRTAKNVIFWREAQCKQTKTAIKIQKIPPIRRDLVGTKPIGGKHTSSSPRFAHLRGRYIALEAL